MKTVVVWVLIMGMGHSNGLVDGFKTKEACEDAFLAVKGQIELDGDLAWQPRYHACVGVVK